MNYKLSAQVVLIIIIEFLLSNNAQIHYFLVHYAQTQYLPVYYA